MKKSMIIMCTAALVALCTPMVASESNNTPPVKQEIRIVNETDLSKNQAGAPESNTPESADVNGQESSGSSSHSGGGGYVVISGAGLLLILILLILIL